MDDVLIGLGNKAEYYHSTEEIIKDLRGFLPKKISYGELVGAPEVYAHSGPMVYADPESYCMEAAANRLEELQRELVAAKQQRDDAIRDMKILADTMREYLETETKCCGLCGYESLNEPSYEYPGSGDNCPGVDKTHCFKWRGLSEQESAVDITEMYCWNFYADAETFSGPFATIEECIARARLANDGGYDTVAIGKVVPWDIASNLPVEHMLIELANKAYRECGERGWQIVDLNKHFEIAALRKAIAPAVIAWLKEHGRYPRFCHARDIEEYDLEKNAMEG